MHQFSGVRMCISNTWYYFLRKNTINRNTALMTTKDRNISHSHPQYTGQLGNNADDYSTPMMLKLVPRKDSERSPQVFYSTPP